MLKTACVVQLILYCTNSAKGGEIGELGIKEDLERLLKTGGLGMCM